MQKLKRVSFVDVFGARHFKAMRMDENGLGDAELRTI